MLGGNPIFFVFFCFCSSINTQYYLCSNCVLVFLSVFEPSKTFGMICGDSWFHLAEKQKLLRSLPEFWKITKAFFWSVFFTKYWYRNCLGFPKFSKKLELQKYTKFSDYYRLFCFWQILFSMCHLLILMGLWVVSVGMNHREVGIE